MLLCALFVYMMLGAPTCVAWISAHLQMQRCLENFYEVFEIPFSHSLYSSLSNNHYIGKSEWVNEWMILNTALVTGFTHSFLSGITGCTCDVLPQLMTVSLQRGCVIRQLVSPGSVGYVYPESHHDQLTVCVSVWLRMWVGLILFQKWRSNKFIIASDWFLACKSSWG